MRRRLFPRKRLTVALLLLSTLPGLAALAGTQGPYSVEILVDGRPLREYRARGTTYVEALAGRDYAVRLRNHTGRRVAVALSIDGLNTIDAKSGSARQAAKWILDPYASVTLQGWQTSSSAARRFFFTTEERSYGNWLGRTDNLGLISAVFFREKQPLPVPYTRLNEGQERRRDAPSGGTRLRRSKAGNAEPLAPAPDEGEDYAATGIGSKLEHRVRRVPFEAEERPAAELNLRYEYRDALVRLGVLPDRDEPLARRERARGFTDSGFAPDPWE